MSADYASSRDLFDDVHTLVMAALSGEIDFAEQRRLERLVCERDDARRLYVQYLSEATALRWWAEQPSESDIPYRAASLFPTLSRIVRPVLGSIALVALVTYGAFALIAWNLRPDQLPDAKRGRSASVALITDTANAQWSKTTLSKSGSTAISRGELLRIDSGRVELQLNHGTMLVIEGPASWTIDGDNSATLTSGKLVAHVSPESKGFVLNTPSARIVDLGTEFAVQVNSAAVTQVEVLKGVIEVAPVPSEKQLYASRKVRLVAGDVRSISLGNVTLPEYVVDLPRRTELPNGPHVAISRSQSARLITVSLFKPVSTSSSLSASGLPLHVFGAESVAFPAENAVDGQLDDGGLPDHFSYWLAENEKPAELTIDLEDSQEIAEVWLQNTHNRQHNDRGTRQYRLSASVDGKDFVTFADGELPNAAGKETISIQRVRLASPVLARYVRFEAVTWFGYGAGLNEIAVLKRSSEPAVQKTH